MTKHKKAETRQVPWDERWKAITEDFQTVIQKHHFHGLVVAGEIVEHGERRIFYSVGGDAFDAERLVAYAMGRVVQTRQERVSQLMAGVAFERPLKKSTP